MIDIYPFINGYIAVYKGKVLAERSIILYNLKDTPSKWTNIKVFFKKG